MSEIKISEALASLDDMKAVSKMLRPIREAEQVRAALLKRESGRLRGYDEESQTAHCIVSDGRTAACFTVSGVSLQQAAEIMAESDLIKEWSASAFQAAVERALDAQAERIN